MATRPTTRALFHRQEAARFRRCEAALARRFERVLVVGEPDAQALTPVWGRGRTRVVPISIGDSIRRPDGRSDAIDHVLLYGALDDPPNVEALELYFREVWPALRLGSLLRTVVIGSGRAPVRLGGADDRVEVRGSVPDITAKLIKAGVLLTPPGSAGPAPRGSRKPLLPECLSFRRRSVWRASGSKPADTTCARKRPTRWSPRCFVSPRSRPWSPS